MLHNDNNRAMPIYNTIKHNVLRYTYILISCYVNLYYKIT